MASIGSLAFELVAKSAGLFKQVETEGEKAGDRAAQSFSQRFGTALKAGLATAAVGAFALATKGAVELDTATRNAAAAAGIAADEMAGFRSQVVELYKANPTKSFDELSATIGTLKTDLGFTTTEAGKAAQSFLDFSKVTGQDGVAAVKGLDDVLDAYNLDASESQRIMDLLVASHEKYGGSVTENQAALAAMAPQLQALNLGLDDGVALLNLFASSGLDATAGQRALNTAITELPPGTSLTQFIDQLIAIEDPGERARAAIEVFGARGGAALANALRPGIGGLDEFKLKTGEAAGATERAADVIDDSFANRVNGAIRAVTGPLAELGANAPLILSVVAGAGSIGKAFELAANVATPAIARIRGELLSLIPIVGLIAFALTNEEGSEARQKVDEVTAAYHRARDAAGAAGGAFGATTVALKDSAAVGELLRDVMEHLGRSFVDVTSAADETAEATEHVGVAGEVAADTLADAWPDAAKVAKGLAAEMPDAVEDEIGRTEQAGMDTIDAYIAAIDGGRGAFVDAWAGFTKAQATALTVQQQMAIIGGLLATKKLAKGLNDARPDVRAAARGVVIEGLNQLIALGGPAGLAGTAAGQQFAHGFGAGAGMENSTFNANAVSTAQILATLNAAFAAGGIAINEYNDDTAKLEADLARLLGLLGDAGGATRGKAAADKAGAKAAREADQAEKERISTLKGKLTDALREARDQALDYFRRLHDKNLEAIRDTRDRTYAEIEESRKRIRQHLDEVRAREMAPVTAAEQALRAVEDQRRLRDLNEAIADAQQRLSEAQASGDQAAIASATRSLTSAQEALSSFQAQQAIDALRATAEANIAAAESEAKTAEDGLDAREAAADAVAEAATKAENERYDAQVKNFDRSFDALTKYLTDTETSHANAQARITALYKAFNISAEAIGKDFGAKYAAGVLASKKAVEEAAEELAKVIEDFLKTHSPARRGPLHETSPEEMGEAIGLQLGRGVQGGLNRFQPTIPQPVAPFAGLAAPSFAPVGGFGGIGSQTITHGGPTYNVTVNNPTPEPAGWSVRRRLALVGAGFSQSG